MTLPTWEQAADQLAQLALPRTFQTHEVGPSIIGHVLAEDVRSVSPNPRFRMSAMDGWAIHLDDLGQGSNGVAIGNTVLAGMEATELMTGTTCAVMTGAPVPSSTAAVIPVEDGHEKDGRLYWDTPLRQGQHIRKQGEDFDTNQIILPTGTKLTPQHMVVLRTAGVQQVKVLKPVAITLIQTGNELAAADAPLGAASVWESTRECLVSSMQKLGPHHVTCRQVPDTQNALKTVVQQALTDGTSLIITTGGVSKGVADHVPDVAKALGATIVLHRLAMKPAKPLLVAIFPSGAILVGLPGNPVSQLIALQAAVFPLLLGQPMLRGMMMIKATLTDPCSGKTGFRTFIRGCISVSEKGHLQVQPLGGNESHRVANLATCNGWLHVVGDHAAGSLIDVSPFMETVWRLTA